MPGRVKKRIAKLRVSGEEFDLKLADWLEAKEVARSEGKVLWKWEKDNPKPIKASDIEARNDAIRNKMGLSVDVDPSLLPESDLKVVDKISSSIESLKKKPV